MKVTLENLRALHAAAKDQEAKSLAAAHAAAGAAQAYQHLIVAMVEQAKKAQEPDVAKDVAKAGPEIDKVAEPVENQQ